MEIKSWISALGDGMKLSILIALFAAALLLGCTSPQAPAPINNGTAPPAYVAPNVTQNVPVNVTPPPPVVNSTPPVNNTPAVNTTANTQPTNTVPVDCSSLTPECGACIAKPGCGWCKSLNSCLQGDASGPSGNTCPAVDWATTPTECTGPVGGNSCVSKTNCADCLSGSGCKWCQEGTKCADASSTDNCAAGGWRNTSYECYGGQ